MPSFRVLSAADQVADHLREEVFRQTWTETMPGGAKLAKDLGVGHMTVEAALAILEKEGLLSPQGSGRRRKIVLPDGGNGGAKRPLRIAILPCLPGDLRVDYIVDLQHMLGEEAHSVILSDHAMNELGMNLNRISKLVEKIHADAWVVVAGSRKVLEWFANNPLPAFAMFGRRRGLPIAAIGPDKVTAMRVITARLIELGHRSISVIARPLRRIPEPGLPEKEFIKCCQQLVFRLVPTICQTGTAQSPACTGDWTPCSG